MTVRSTAIVGEADHVEREVLAVVGRLAAELGTLPPRRAVALDHVLDRDLGFGSLERVELMFRLEQAFGIEFPDTVMTEAERVRDLVTAIGVAAPPSSGPAEPTTIVPGAGRRAPDSAATLTDVLAWHVETEADRVHVILLDERGHESPITYGALWRDAAAVGAGLLQRGITPGDAIGLMLRTEAAFFPTFFGVLAAGGVPVPIYPPWRADRLEEYARRQVRILQNAQARMLVTFEDARGLAGLLGRRAPSLHEVTTPDSLAAPGAAVTPRQAPDDAALIQYTSGSTGDPKGVLLTHDNILANIRALGRALDLRSDDVGVSWLPLYHDMGLIGSWLASLYHGLPIVIMAPTTFLARPARWLHAIAAHRGTVSPAPNFAFDLCAKRIRDEEMAGVDLSTWRLALNGAEPVSPETIERFTGRFRAWGFRPEAMSPGYGLAESAVALTLSPPGRGPRVDAVDRAVFERDRRARPGTADDAWPIRFVSCGLPLPDHEVRIVDGAGRPLDERVEGRIEFRGPSVTSGYFRNPEATRAAVRGGWFDSGDLGYRADGELFVTGRQKDIIIKAGRNLYPQEIEELVGDLPGIRKGSVAAFGVTDPAVGTERLVVVAESERTQTGTPERLRADVVDRMVTALGIPADTVVIVAPDTVLKTPSGKIRHAAMRDAYVTGALGRRPASARAERARIVLADLGARLRAILDAGRRLLFLGRVAAVLAVALPPLWLLVTLRRGDALDRGVRRWCRLLLAAAGCRPTVHGLDHVPPAGAVVIAANHASYLDAAVLLASFPGPFRFVAKRELVSAPLVGRVIDKVGHLTVERVDLSRKVADAERVVAALRAGISLLVFPEGTFVRAAGLLPFRLGAFKAAVEAGCPIVPVAIRGTGDVLPADTWRPRPGAISVTISAPIVPAGRSWREVVRVRDATRTAIASSLCPE